MNKIIFGGAFDPIHLGHINMALVASKHFDADIIFVPSPIAIWKNSSAPIKDKIEMIKLSIQKYPRFSIDLFEVESGKELNYSINTVHYFKDKYPDDEIYYLIGSDQVNEFHRWKNCEEMAKLAHIIFFSRPNFNEKEENIKKFDMQEIVGKTMNISSSDIRSLKCLKIDDKVIKYIEDHNLYYINKVRSFIKDKRYNHSLAVANLAYQIATVHHRKNKDQYYIAGLLHDIGKETGDMKIMTEHFNTYLDLPPFAYHQFIGSYIAKTEFNITNRSVLKAIEFHATGNKQMDLLGQVIYAADKIEPTRDYNSNYMIEAMMEDINKGFKLVLSENKKFLEENRQNINNRLTVNCFSYFL